MAIKCDYCEEEVKNKDAYHIFDGLDIIYTGRLRCMWRMMEVLEDESDR